jgi:hypothetical protein
MAKNLRGKTRPLDDPYEIYQSLDGEWEWKVLKHYKSEESENTDRYARVFCGVKSPMTYGSYELGDVYLREVLAYGTLVYQDDLSVKEQ